MKKKKFVFIVLLLVAIFTFFPINTNYSYATVDLLKKNQDSYWSTKNAPIFYGATKITLKKGIIESFDLNDSRFRIFAKDFEDGDLTTEIISSGSVDVNTPGTYELSYQVTDSHGNQAFLTVPVIITEDENAKINVERTVFTLPSMWNMDKAGFSRTNYGYRQIFGVFMPAGTSINVRVLEAEDNISMGFVTNDTYNEATASINKNGEWTTLKNKIGTEDQVEHDSVPFIVTNVLPQDRTVINKTYKIEVEYDTSVKELHYYHYKDDEEAFFSKWRELQDSYAVVENEVVMVIVPFYDIDKMVNYYRNGFTSLDQFFEYYQKAVDTMDKNIGLDLNPEKLTDQNVRVQVLVRPNIHGAGAAYYNGNHVGINNRSVASFFEMNWGGLHEIAHGYQGSLGRGEMGLGEISNNILGHYIQIDKSIYFHNGDWLGDIPTNEERRNASRLEGTAYTSIDVGDRLYMIVNLFDAFEGADTYAKMFSWYREQVNNGRSMTNQDAYVKSIADIYGVNIIPYMEAWNLTISDKVKEEIYEKNYPMVNILKDILSDESLSTVMTGEGMDRKYGLVQNDILNRYNITGMLTINIDIDDVSAIKGKTIVIKSGDNVVKKATIETNQVILTDMPVGTYYIQMPINSNYIQQHATATIKDNVENTITYTYERIGEKEFDNYIVFDLLGIYGTFGYNLRFSDHYTKATIKFNGANIGVNNDASVVIYDENRNVISSEEAVAKNASEKYFDFNKESYSVDLKPGYKIVITHSVPSRVVFKNTLSLTELTAYKPDSKVTTYTVVENGLLKDGMTEDDAKEIAYASLREQLIKYIEEYKTEATKEELENKFKNFQRKAEIIQYYNALREEDKEPYTDFITQIIQGGKPIVETVGITEYNVNEKVDLYSLISARDNEDGEIAINESTTTISTNLNTSIVGTYPVTYVVSDSDNNKTSYTINIVIKAINNENPPQEETPVPDHSDQNNNNDTSNEQNNSNQTNSGTGSVKPNTQTNNNSSSSTSSNSNINDNTTEEKEEENEYIDDNIIDNNEDSTNGNNYEYNKPTTSNKKKVKEEKNWPMLFVGIAIGSLAVIIIYLFAKDIKKVG